jgi:hypothetical protein
VFLTQHSFRLLLINEWSSDEVGLDCSRELICVWIEHRGLVLVMDLEVEVEVADYCWVVAVSSVE